MTPNEQIITAPAEDITDAAKAELLKKEFDSNFTKVSEALQTPEKADTIAHLLDTNFKKGLEDLYKKTEKNENNLTGAEQIKSLGYDLLGALIDIKALIAKTKDKKTLKELEVDKTALENLQKIITPMGLEATTLSFTIENPFTTELSKTEGTVDGFNKTNRELTKKAYTKINEKITEEPITFKYSKLPGVKNIANALSNPTTINIQSLQEFLYNNITDETAKAELEKSSKKESGWDGKYGSKTDAALTAYLKDFDDYQANPINNQAQVDEAQKAAITAAESGDLLEKAYDAQMLADINKSITTDHPERTNKTPIVSPDKTTISYRGQTYTAPAGYGLTASISKTVNSTPVEESADFLERQKAQDKILDAKVMTYNTDLNMYLYRNKAISRNDVGSEDGQMTLQEFKSKVDQTSTDDTNEFNETTKETSADGKVTRKFVDLKYDKGYRDIIKTFNDAGDLLSKKVETRKNNTTRSNLTTYNADGSETINKTKTAPGVTVAKERKFDKDGIFVTKGTRTRTNKNTGRTSTVTVDNTGVNVGPGSNSRDIIDLFKPETYVNNFGKTVEDKNSFRAKAEYLPFAITSPANTTNLEAVTADYIGKALNTQQIENTRRTTSINAGTNIIKIPEVTDKNSLTANYTIVQKGNKIDISLKKEGTPLSQKTFDAEMKRILEIAGVANIQMFNFASKGKKDTPTSDINITDYSFTVGSESKKIKQIATNESASVPTADPEQNESLPEAVKNAFTLLGTRKQEGITNTITLHAPDTKISKIQQGHIDIIENNGYTVRYLSNKSDGIITTLEVTPKLVPMQSITKDQIPVSLEKINSMKHAFHIDQQATEEILSPEKIDQLKDLESQGIIPSALTEDILRHYDLNEKNYPNYIPLNETHPQTVNYPGTNFAYSDVYEYLYGKLKTEREGHGIEFSYPRSPSEKVSGTIGFVGGVFEIEQTNGTTLTFQNVYELNKDYFIVRSNNAKYKISKGTTNEQGVYMASMEAYTDNDAQIEQVTKL